MPTDLNRADVTLAELLRARAARATARGLTASLVGGAMTAGVFAWQRPAGWTLLVSAGLCVFMYGAWSVAERHVQSSPWNSSTAVVRGWRLLRALTATLGVLSLFAVLASLLVHGLGTWIS